MKKIAIVAGLLLLLLQGASFGGGPCPGPERVLRPLGYQQLTVSSTAVALTLPTTGPARMAVLVIETNTIRYRDDGTDPTASVGVPIVATQALVLCDQSLVRFKAIRASADATANISYYGD